MPDVMRRYLRYIAKSFLAFPRRVKRSLVVLVDICFCILTTWLALYLRLDDFVRLNTDFAQLVFLSLVIALPIFAMAGLYRAIFRYSGWLAILGIGRAMSLYSLIYVSIVIAVGLDGTPRTIGIIQPLLLFFCVASSRILARYWLGSYFPDRFKEEKNSRALIYGAGAAGRQLASALDTSNDMHVVGFLDDNDHLHDHILNGKPVFNPDDCASLIDSKRINYVLLAIPSVSRSRRNEILKKLSAYAVDIRTLPSVTELVQGRITTSDLHELDIDDLLGREVVAPDPILLGKNITGKVVFVTGAGGSIGSELCRQILRVKPAKLLLVDISEFALYVIYSELEAFRKASVDCKAVRIVPLLGSVQDEGRMREIMDTWLPDTIYHVAAYKHVPLVEHNVTEGVKNNVIGSLVTAQLAIEKGVSDFVLISTDKAVRPTNIMGASKRVAELCLQALWFQNVQANESERCAITKEIKRPQTTLSMVRFGNVLGSSGSVIPKFRQQIRNGGPITLTHLEITRYFMTIKEAAQLVIQAGAMAEGGDVFVLDMGESVKIVDLAKRMVELSGLTVLAEDNPDGDIEIIVTGLRPGEKLYEELMLGDDLRPTVHPKIQRAQDPFIPWNELKTEIDTLKAALSDKNVELTVRSLQKLVLGYRPFDNVVDWVFSEQSCQATELEKPNGL